MIYDVCYFSVMYKKLSSFTFFPSLEGIVLFVTNVIHPLPSDPVLRRRVKRVIGLVVGSDLYIERKWKLGSSFVHSSSFDQIEAYAFPCLYRIEQIKTHRI